MKDPSARTAIGSVLLGLLGLAGLAVYSIFAFPIASPTFILPISLGAQSAALPVAITIVAIGGVALALHGAHKDGSIKRYAISYLLLVTWILVITFGLGLLVLSMIEMRQTMHAIMATF